MALLGQKQELETFENSYEKLTTQRVHPNCTLTCGNVHTPQIVQTNAKDIKDLKIQ